MTKVISLLSGIIFGIGLTVSEMVNPVKILGFLNLSGGWDPSLIFVMAGAILLCLPFFYLMKNKTKPLFVENFSIPQIKNIDSQLFIGSSLFGFGWGVVGLCPGPAIASLSFMNKYSIIFITSMLVGFFAIKFIKIKV